MTTPPNQPPTRSARTLRGAAVPNRLVAYGVDATTGEYLLPEIVPSRIARAVTGAPPTPEELADADARRLSMLQTPFGVVEGVDPNDLSQSGWAVAFPAVAEGSEAAARQAAVRDALAPLLVHRRAEAGALYQEYTGERGYRAGETKQQYLARLGAGPGPVRPQKVPYYLLLVAAPEEIPFQVQYQLDVQYAVGRIAFDTVEEYARYARSVVDAETGQVTRARRASFFGVANPDDVATQLSADHLVAPLVEYVTGRGDRHGFTVDSQLGDAATRARLIELLADPPALLFTASHGMGFPSGHDAQRDRQGAILCQDWPGPGNRVGREHYFTGEDLPAQADLRGMIGVLFACFGGGTPMRDDFAHRALGEADARTLSPAPLIARLPQRMLGHPAGGALAVVGHIDRAWGSAFLWIDPEQELETQSHREVFESLLDSLLAGKRLGLAMESFSNRYAELAADLSERIDGILSRRETYDDAELAHMWICSSDARNYAVLGDPAVRLAGGAVARAPSPEPIVQPPDPPQPGPTGGPSSMPASTSDSLTTPPAAPQPPGTGNMSSRGAPSIPDFGLFGSDGKDDKQPGFLAQLGTKLGDVLGKVLNDAAVLEVKTYTSDDMKGVATGDGLHATGARLRAYTRCELDGDTEVCVPVNAGGAVDEALWTLHLEMVKQAQAHRAELLKTVLALFTPRVVR
ncbi:MAG TPA: hypothetical protein VFK02_18360 [Kofleriaceae bacterium]|nr:hypothetical protein [Kofleriaceae bacterium]